MKKGLFSWLVFLLLVVSNAQATSVAVIDIDKVLKNYPVVQRIDSKLRQQFSPRAAKITAQQKEIETKIGDLNRNASIMTDAQRDDLQAEINSDKNDLQVAQTQFAQDLEKAQNQDMQKVLKTINQAIVNVAKAKGYEVVLQKDRTLYINDSVDISNSILAILTGSTKNLNGK